MKLVVYNDISAFSKRNINNTYENVEIFDENNY